MILNPLKKYLKEIKDIVVYDKYYKKYKEYTMMPSRNFIDCLALLARFKNIEGSIVECGVWRGGMSAAIAEIFGNEREYYLIDSYEGLPPAKDIDGQAALAWQKDRNSPNYLDNCKAEIEWAQKAMAKSGAKNVHFVKGWFQDTLPGYKFDEPIAVLRLDGDWYDSVLVCLEHLFPKVAKGGVVMIDDYYIWEGASKAIHEYLAKYKRPERLINSWYLSGCYLIKQ
jgi:O-methyltransferase